METQSTFNLIFGALLSGIGGALMLAFKGVHDVEKDLSNLIAAMPETYARRDDLRDLIAEVRASLLRIENKLDNKADK